MNRSYRRLRRRAWWLAIVTYAVLLVVAVLLLVSAYLGLHWTDVAPALANATGGEAPRLLAGRLFWPLQCLQAVCVVVFCTIVAVLLLTLPFIGRVIVGPTIFDRVVALNGTGTLVAVALVLVGLIYERVDMFVDIALALFLLNLFTTLLVARYVRHSADTEP